MTKIPTVNYLTICDQTLILIFSPSEKSPRGIPGFQLNGGKFTTWKVQGKLGGYTKSVLPRLEKMNYVLLKTIIRQLPRQNSRRPERRRSVR